MKVEIYAVSAMSEEQLSALLARLKEDAGLREKFKGAADLDAAVVIAKEAGFDVGKSDLLRYQAKQMLELSEEELESAAGGVDQGTVSAVKTLCFNIDCCLARRPQTGI